MTGVLERVYTAILVWLMKELRKYTSPSAPAIVLWLTSPSGLTMRKLDLFQGNLNWKRQSKTATNVIDVFIQFPGSD